MQLSFYVCEPFLGFPARKGSEQLIVSSIDNSHSFYRVVLGVLQETTNSSKLGLSEGFLAQLCGFLGGWEGVSPLV